MPSTHAPSQYIDSQFKKNRADIVVDKRIHLHPTEAAHPQTTQLKVNARVGKKWRLFRVEIEHMSKNARTKHNMTYNMLKVRSTFASKGSHLSTSYALLNGVSKIGELEKRVGQRFKNMPYSGELSA